MADWLSTLESIKDTKSRSNRLRVLDGYLKLLYHMGIRERMTIENWDPVKTFATCLEPLEPEDLQDGQMNKTYSKALNRFYEIIDILHVNKSNLAYNADIQPTIRRRLQGYMISMASNLSELLKKSAKAIRLVKKVQEKFEGGF